MSRAVQIDFEPRRVAARRRFERRFPLERRSEELAACARPPAWDESGYPVVPRAASLPVRMWRLLER